MMQSSNDNDTDQTLVGVPVNSVDQMIDLSVSLNVSISDLLETHRIAVLENRKGDSRQLEVIEIEAGLLALSKETQDSGHRPSALIEFPHDESAKTDTE